MRGGFRAAMVGLAAGAAALAVAPAASAATAATAVIVKPGTTTPLEGGASSTLYGVALPSGASCPGDTQHDGYRVYTYLVPAGHLPTEVSFKTELPGRWYGYFADGAYIGALDTAVTSGQIVGIPTAFTWTRLTPQDLNLVGHAQATWNGGIACVDTHGVVTDYWNNAVRFTADASDPSGFTWKVVAQGTLTSSFDPTPYIGGALLLVAAAAGAYALALRRRRTTHETDETDTAATGGPDVSAQEGATVDEREPVGS